MLLYELTTPGAPPISLTEVKLYLKIAGSADDALITSLIASATEYGQKYTGREFTNNVWKMYLDQFHVRIQVNRNPIDTIDTISHLVLGVPTVIPPTDYYLKNETASSEILLVEDKDWPTDTDNREHAIEVDFTTKPYKCIELIKNALLIHVAYLHSNRGDCVEAGITTVYDGAVKSGVTALYNQFRIPRV